MYKLMKIFEEVTGGPDGEIKEKQQLDNLMNRLLERKVIIEQDKKLLNIHNFYTIFKNF